MSPITTMHEPIVWNMECKTSKKSENDESIILHKKMSSTRICKCMSFESWGTQTGCIHKQKDAQNKGLDET